MVDAKERNRDHLQFQPGYRVIGQSQISARGYRLPVGQRTGSDYPLPPLLARALAHLA